MEATETVTDDVDGTNVEKVYLYVIDHQTFLTNIFSQSDEQPVKEKKLTRKSSIPILDQIERQNSPNKSGSKMEI